MRPAGFASIGSALHARLRFSFTLVVAASLAGSIGGCKSEKSKATPQAAASSQEQGHRPNEPIAAPSTTELLPLAVGQWTRHRITDAGRVSTLSQRVVGEEDGAHWVEIVTGSADAGTVLQILVRLTDRKSPESAEIRGAKVRMPNGKVKEVRGAMLEPAKEGYRKSLADLFVSGFAGLPQEDVSVPAGTFLRCYVRQARSSFAGLESDAKVRAHPAVPIAGTVSAETPDGKSRLELVDFGLTGAKAEL